MQMARVMRNASRNLALEIARGNRHVVYTGFVGASNDGSIGLQSAELREFDHEYKEEAPPDSHGELSPRRFARCLLRNNNYRLTGDCVSALIDVMCLSSDEPRSDRVAILVQPNGAFAGGFESSEDAEIVRKFVSGIVISSTAQMRELPEGVLQALKTQVAPALKAKGRKLIEGVFAMAKAADKPAAPAATKVEKVKKERVVKTDGPVAKVAQYVKDNLAAFKNGTLTKVAAVDALVKMGIVKGTIGVQLPRRLKEAGIDAAKGSRAAPKPPKGDAAGKPKTAKDSGLQPAAPAKAAKAPAAKKPAKVAAKKPAKKK